MERGDYSDAENCFRRAHTMAPESLETILNLGYALDMQGRSAEAFACYEAVLAVAPENAKARYNRAAHLLRAGDFVNGFADYEARFSAMKSADSRIYSQPRWNGSPLYGQSILVYCEQGLGDAIQFARYIPLLAERGGRVILETQQPLVSLLASLNGVEKVVLKSEVPPPADFHIPLLSLPHLFGTTTATIPVDVPYLVPPPDKVAYWRETLGDTHNIFRIGLVWAGKQTPDPNRSCLPDYLAPLLTIGGTRFYSLQFDEHARLPLSKKLADTVIDLADDIGDFAKTAALITNLDLLITIDTALAHLAGALGKPVWVMLPFAPDWRWMSNRSDSPWYPTMRLFRQPRPEEWESVISEVAQALRQLVLQENKSEVSDELLETSFQKALTAMDSADPDTDTAIYELRKLLLHLPDDPAVRFNLGRAYDMDGQFAEAELAYRQVLVESPDSPAVWFALGEIRLKQKAYPEAEFCLRKAHMLNPESVDILLRFGSALSAQGKTAEAIIVCKKILDICPDCSQAVYNMASLQLRRGDFLSGFANFEVRLAIEKFAIDLRRYLQPRWDGSPLNGRSILLYGEQGMGDVIQFARYIPLVAERGGAVVFEVDPPLIPLFESFPGVDRIIPKSKEPPLTDVYIQLLSLPYIFGTTVDTVPTRIPYIFPDMAKAAKWREKLGDSQDFRVGLVWSGNPGNPRDKERSSALSIFAPLGSLPKVAFYSLQVGSAALEAASPPAGMLLTDYSALLTDFTETAALIANLDLVICVDTAVAHLAGAMGQQVWVLLPEGSEWRWLEGRADTPWYPTMRVFEHESDSDWEGMIQRVRVALKTLLAEKSNSAGPMGVETSYNLGVSLKEAGDLEGAERCFRDIVEQQPELPDPQQSLGVVLQLQGRLQEAIRQYRTATTLDPGFVKAHYNLANAFLQSGLYQDALESVKTAIQCDPSHADAHWLLGMLLLQSGDFTNGWREYEWRWKAFEFTSRIPDLGRPQWDGSALEGRTLLIHMEQGRGDMIQFIRYAPLAAAMGGMVVACAVPELVSLLASVEGISVVDRNGALPDFDIHAPVQSLPYLFSTTLETVPQNIPYLRADPVKVAEWLQIFPDEEHFRIGIVWQGTPTHRDDHNRSCSLREFLKLGDLDGIDIYSLQIGAGAEQLIGLPDGMLLIDATEHIQDFSDTAAIIANLDLVISVDTAAAHLAGALGKPVWTLLPHLSEWRWLLDRDDTPWYPTMRLFRQALAGDWEGLFHRLRDKLELLLGSSDLLNQLGITLLKSGSAGRAERAFARAIACDPQNAQSYCNRGVALDAQRGYESAISCYQEAIALQPDFASALFNMGNSYISLDQLQEALTCYGRVIELEPASVAAYLSLGEVGKTLRNFPLARAAFERAASLDPESADAFRGVADIDLAEERFEDAIAAYSRAAELNPDDAATFNLMGATYQSNEQLDEAEECYRKALTVTPDNLTALNNLGVVLDAQGRRDEAVVVYRHLLDIAPDYADGHWNLSVALLAIGAYAEGWREFEWRFRKSNPVPSRPFTQPTWDGSDLAGKTILLHAEQGFGDTIQFVRYVPLVQQRGGQVIIECQTEILKRLVSPLDTVSGGIAAGETLPHFDCHLPMMSLPLVFGTTVETIPCQIPYLAAELRDREKWQQRLGASGRLKVGLVWHAKQSQLLNRKRSCPLKFFSPLWIVEGVEFYTLQIGAGAEQLDDFAVSHEIIDLTGDMHDFADTAAFIANLDLVITIDTAVAHLAGALGARTWVVLPYTSEWRWLCRREESPWYPTMRLFRQPSQGDWPSVMDHVAVALSDCVERSGSGGTYTDTNSPTLLVGLAWAGRQDNPLDWRRSCPFSALAPLFKLPNVRFVKLQPDLSDGKTLNEMQMINLTEYIHDFEDTAALMAHLDLIISIDTSVAHLAAATGRPTWVLLPHVAEWRWLTNRDDSPWYPGMRLFRQSDHGDWDGLIQEVASCLANLSNNGLSWNERFEPENPHCGYAQERQILEQQLEKYRETASENNSSPDAKLNVGAALALLGRDTEAIEVFRHVLQLDPEHVAGHLNLAYSLLAVGEYSEGWEHFEWRLRRVPPGLLPSWPMLDKNSLGTHPAGLSIMVHSEQGYGDTIQFSRFLPLLAKTGYRVIVSCQPQIASLVASLPGVSRVIPHGEPLPPCDLQVLLLTLPGLFLVTQESLAASIPRLAPGKLRVERWKERLNRKKRATLFFV